MNIECSARIHLFRSDERTTMATSTQPMACSNSIITFFCRCYCCACHYQLNKIFCCPKCPFDANKSSSRWIARARKILFLWFESTVSAITPAPPCENIVFFLLVFSSKTHAIVWRANEISINDLSVLHFGHQKSAINEFKIRWNVRCCHNTSPTTDNCRAKNVALCISVTSVLCLLSTCFHSKRQVNLSVSMRLCASCTVNENLLPELTHSGEPHINAGTKNAFDNKSHVGFCRCSVFGWCLSGELHFHLIVWTLEFNYFLSVRFHTVSVPLADSSWPRRQAVLVAL